MVNGMRYKGIVFDKDGTVRREVKHCTIEQLYVEQTFAGGL